MILLKKIFSFFLTSIGILCLILLFSGVYPYVVLSGSMEPSVKTGSVVLVQTRNQKFQEGDVILYQSDVGNVTHRVVKIQEDQFITKGDANKTADPYPVDRTQIKGKIWAVIPYFGYGICFLKTWKGISLLVLSVIIVISVKQLYKCNHF